MELLLASTIQLSEEEMKAMNKTSVALQDGSGYLGYLETFHMLHCVVGDLQLFPLSLMLNFLRDARILCRNGFTSSCIKNTIPMWKRQVVSTSAMQVRLMSQMQDGSPQSMMEWYTENT